MDRGRPKPSIFQVGIVRRVDGGLVATGWGLTTCASRCPCHLDRFTGALSLSENAALGTLGLVSYRADGVACGCCEPWSTEELAAIVKDFAAVAALQETASPR
jgi:hypothetical protein